MSAIAEAARRSGLAEDPLLLAEDLEASGVFRREGESLEFEHDIWRRHFESKACLDAGVWATPQSIREWIAARDRAEIYALLPFLSGLIRDAEAQETLFDALLRKDLELYLRALPLRAAFRPGQGADAWAGHCLQGLRRGYVDLVERHFPAFKPYVDPWCFGDRDEDQKVVLVGRLHPRNLSYYFMLAPEQEEDVVLDYDGEVRASDEGDTEDVILPVEYVPNSDTTPILEFTFYEHDHRLRELDLALSLKRPGSTRLIAAELLLNNIEDALKENLIETPWTMRERFVHAFFRTYYHGKLDAWLRQTVGDMMRLAALSLKEEAPQGEERLAFSNSNESDTQALGELAVVGEWLARHGLASVTLSGLVLPGPEFVDDEMHYSTERRLARVDALCRATAETYRLLCLGLSDEVRSHFYFAQWPCRAVVEVEVEDGGESAGWVMYWEACEDWESPPVVRATHGRSNLLSHFERLVRQERERCRRWGRRFINFKGKSTVGSWNLWEDAVTREVNGLLVDDIQRLKHWLGNGT
jgi:hypothetical protein